MGIAGNGWYAALLSLGVLACGSDERGADDSSGDESSVEGDSGTQARTGTGTVDGGSGAHADGGAPGPNTCATATTGVELLPVHLAFAFDVSGSMGNGDKPWHDKALKWDPVVRATRSFFAAQSSSGITASLTFFPGEARICNASEYTTPDVAMTPLPSALFGQEIDRIAPMSSADWRSGTPTVAVMSGVQTAVTSYRSGHDGRFAIVLVTDGYPQSCGSADSVDKVVTEADKALGSGVATYVIGVANPMVTGAPDTVSDLHRIAAAGGTEQAFLIDTGDPEKTANDFSRAVDQIRQASTACSVAIPEPGSGAAFDKESVAVHVSSKAGTTVLGYDKTCSVANAWHYDNVDDPHQIVLCSSTCDSVRGDDSAQLSVEFACEPLLVL